MDHQFKEVNFHNKYLTCLKWNCDGRLLGSASADKTVKIGQLESAGNMKLLQTVEPGSVMTAVCWHPTDPTRFSIAGDEKSIEMWDVRAPKVTAKINSVGQFLFASWSPDGNHVAFVNNADNVLIFDVNAMKLIKKLKMNSETNEISWSANSDHLLVATAAGGKGSLDLLGFRNPDVDLIDSIAAHDGSCMFLKVDTNFRHMVTGSADGSIGLWDFDDLVCHNMVSIDSPVRGLALRGDGKYVAAMGETSNLRVFNTETGELAALIDCKYPAVAYANAMDWHPTLDIIALGVEDKERASSHSSLYQRLLKIFSLPKPETI